MIIYGQIYMDFSSKLVKTLYFHQILVNHQVRDNYLIVVLSIVQLILSGVATRITISIIHMKFDFKHIITKINTGMFQIKDWHVP